MFTRFLFHIGYLEMRERTRLLALKMLKASFHFFGAYEKEERVIAVNCSDREEKIWMLQFRLGYWR